MDQDVEIFVLSYNRKIEYLPENIIERFPKLMIIHARSCSIKSITKINFKDMQQVIDVWLDGNQIEKIESPTFEDFMALKRLVLCE